MIDEGLEPLEGTVILESGVLAPTVLENVTAPVPGTSCSDCAPLIAHSVMLELPPEVSTFKFELAPKTIVPVAKVTAEAAAVVVKVVKAPPLMLMLPEAV